MNTAALTRPTLTLLLFALFCTGLLSGVYLLSKERIAHNEQQQLNQRIQSLLPAGRYDNNPLEDWITLSEKTLGSSPLTIYRARLGQEPVAAVITFSTSAGYNGTIRLIASLNADQSIAGVRVVNHRETPGLGDRIETEKDDWILGFSGTSLQNLPPEQWTVKKEGGYFDQFSGATITPRAVVLAVKAVLLWSQLNWEMVFAKNQDRPVDSRPGEDHIKHPLGY